MQRRAVFLDKDGTLVRNVPHNVDPQRVEFFPDAFAALRTLQALGFRIVLVSNQPGVALGLFGLAALHQLEWHLRSRLADEGVELTAAYWCPHAGHTDCLCRKPAPGLLIRAAHEHHLDLTMCWMIGDILDDVEAGQRAGCRGLLVDTGGETEWTPGLFREPHAIVKTLQQAADYVRAMEERL